MFRRNLIALSAVTSLALFGCSEETKPDPRSEVPLVRTEAVQQASIHSRSFTGVVAAKVQSDLGFRVTGKIKQRLVDTGQKVKAGQVLFRLDPVDLQLAANAQREAVVAARALAKQTADEELRLRGLRGTGAISVSAYDSAKAEADSALAQFKAAEAQAEVAINATGYAELLADSDGIIMATLAEPGQVVAAGQAVARLAHTGPREAVIQLPETLRPDIGSEGIATLFGPNKNAVPTRLRQLSETADPLTRTFEARYVLDAELAKAPLGSTVIIRIPEYQSTETSTVQVPMSALYDNGSGPGVWVVRGDPARVNWLAVTIQQLDSETAFVSATLNSNERIVTLGAHLLRDGQSVRISKATVAVAAAGEQL